MDIKKHPAQYFEKIVATISTVDQQKISDLILKIESAVGTDRKVFIAGNGGSASTSSHMACDLAKTILGKNPRENWKRLGVICLNDNIATMTAWGNDEGYQYIFSEQLINIGKKNDLLILITGSGNSNNILEVARAAKKLGIETFGFLGFDGGKVRGILDDYLIVESDDYGIIEDIHMICVHLITDYLKKL
jgi:D-sedoheptulose 7-phosphate isomerase